MRARIAAAVAATTATAGLLTLAVAPSASAAPQSRSASYAQSEYRGSPRADLDFRDRAGNRIGSGMYTNAHFRFLGTCRTVNGMRLILVRQLPKAGVDGYGAAYSGYVRRDYANLPPNMPC